MSMMLSEWLRPPMDRAARWVKGLQVSEDPRRARFLAALPESLREPFRREFDEHAEKERWITIQAGITPAALAESALEHVENLSDAKLLEWAAGFRAALAGRDTGTCSSLVRSLAAVREPGKARSISGLPLTDYTLRPANLLAFAAQMPPHNRDTFPDLLIAAAEASHAEAGRERLNCTALEVLRNLESNGGARWDEIKAGMRGYDGLDDGTICEFQRLWLASIAAAEPRMQRCLVWVWAKRWSPMRWHGNEPLEKQVSRPARQ